MAYSWFGGTSFQNPVNRMAPAVAQTPAFGQQYTPTVTGQNWSPSTGIWGETFGWSPANSMAEKQWEFPYSQQFGQRIAGMTPQFDPTQAAQYGQQMADSSMQGQVNAMNQYGTGIQNNLNSAYTSAQGAQQQAYQNALNSAPGMSGMLGARDALLKQQQNEAAGNAPQYLVDFWKQQAGNQLQGTMGAFGNSALGAGNMANMMAANLYQYHTGAENALGNTINNWNSYMAPVNANNTYSQYASSMTPSYGTGWNQGVSGYGSQYGANVGAMGNVQSTMDKRFVA